MTGQVERVYVFKRFERLWHWTQATLIIFLGLTGFEVHGSWHWLGFERAHYWHTRLAWALVILTAFAIFWDWTTGEWKQYLLTTSGMKAIARYYAVGIFRNEPHPFKPTELSKLNPLQRITYLAFKILILPVMMTTGLLMIYYNQWPQWDLHWRLGAVALVHTAGAFLLVIFFIVHVYMTTTGHPWFSHIKAMITGWEEIQEREPVTT